MTEFLTLLKEKKEQKRKQFAVLIDPDKAAGAKLDYLLTTIASSAVDYIFLGGSLMTSNRLDTCISKIKENTNIPVVLFPGSLAQIHRKADAILLLSLISGRNPELLIGQHVLAAPELKRSRLEIVPTGYLLIDGGTTTTAHYISNTQAIPAHKPDIAACTAMAGEMLGLQVIYLDTGSGAKFPVSSSIIEAVGENVNIPIIVGGGIDSVQKATEAWRAGADLVVVGNAIEKDLDLLEEIANNALERNL